ncbi:MAG: hypothetical protein U5L96_19640 [Owenweeksia sp.]|nr:hypothetical protein [Owenweeksia sp.]
MDIPNEPIVIHEGSFKIEYASENIGVIGIVRYQWLPEPGVYIEGMCGITPASFLSLDDGSYGNILIDDRYLGKVLIINSSSRFKSTWGENKGLCTTAPVLW